MCEINPRRMSFNHFVEYQLEYNRPHNIIKRHMKTWLRNMSLSLSEVKMLSRKDLTQKDIEYFRIKYGKRFVRALRAVEEGRVKKYHFLPSDTTKWVVQGNTREYLVNPEVFCTCRSFYQSAVIARDIDMCYHMLAQRIAALRNQYMAIESSDADRRRLYAQWRKVG